MNILIAADKFKGSLTAQEVCSNIQFVLNKKHPATNIKSCPMADGGDGSLDILSTYLNLEERSCASEDPLGRVMQANYFVADKTAFIELANTSGLVLLKPSERNPLLTSTKGTGLLIKDAIQNGATGIVLFLGGSATNDAGLGIANALGFQFKDAANNDLKPIGDNLNKIAKIIPGKYLEGRKVSFTLLCDVTNPMYGPRGAAHVFAEQKGADAAQRKLLDDGLRNVSQLFIDQFGKDVSELRGGGAAGAIGAGLCALLNAELKNGFEFIAERVGLAKKIQAADVVITGEGKFDRQSLDGKVVAGVNEMCRRYGKRMIVVVGRNEMTKEELLENGIGEVYELIALAKGTEDAMENAKSYLRRIVENIQL